MQPSQKKVTFITGGSRSGKSSYALTLAESYAKKTFIATAQAMDDEMTSRILNHQKERGESYQTIEEPLEIAKAISSVTESAGVIVLDCLTVWLGNLMYYLPDKKDQNQRIDDFLKILTSPPCDIIIVTNEVGMGIVPENELSRKFRDDAGYLNQQVAQLAQKAILMVSGLPMVIKSNDTN